MAGTFDGVEPVLTVDVICAAGSCTIRVGNAILPVAYRSRSEALRIAERLYSLLVDGYEERWGILCAKEEADGGSGGSGRDGSGVSDVRDGAGAVRGAGGSRDRADERGPFQ